MMMFTAVAAVFIGSLLSPATHAISCYNQTVMPDLMSLAFGALLGVTQSPADLSDALPHDAKLVQGCDSCMRVSFKGAINDSSIGSIKLVMASWSCVVNDKTSSSSSKNDSCNLFSSGDDNFFNTMFADAFPSFANMTGGGDEAPTTTTSTTTIKPIKSSADECASMLLAAKIDQQGSGSMKICTCCDDKCNADSNCGYNLNDS